MFTKFTQWFDRPPPQNATEGRKCDNPDCEAEGKYRAPQSRHQLQHGHNLWFWFCLEHVRAYNAEWNYYQGMTEAEVLEENKEDMTWQRPTWRLNERSGGRKFSQTPRDHFGFFFTQSEKLSEELPSFSHKEAQAMHVLEISYPFTRSDLQKNYRKLVKVYHPDHNHHIPHANDKIREINEAYSILKKMCS